MGKKKKMKDFAKVRLKVGKKLKKTTQTDTTINTKKVGDDLHLVGGKDLFFLLRMVCLQ